MSTLREGTCISHGHPEANPGRRPLCRPAGQSLTAVRASVIQEVDDNLAQFCAEYRDFKRTGILPNGVIRSLMSRATFAPPSERMDVVLGIISQSAVDYVARTCK